MAALVVTCSLATCDGGGAEREPRPPVIDAPVSDAAVSDAAVIDAAPVDAAAPPDADPCAVPRVTSFTGTALRENIDDYPDRIAVTVTWQWTSASGCVDHYGPTGTASYWTACPGCLCESTSIDPNTDAIVLADGTLTVDRSTSPSTYFGHADTQWPMVFSCVDNDGTVDTDPQTAGGVWFDAAGTVAGDRIEGSYETGDYSRCGLLPDNWGHPPCRYAWTWIATRPQ